MHPVEAFISILSLFSAVSPETFSSFVCSMLKLVNCLAVIKDWILESTCRDCLGRLLLNFSGRYYTQV